MDVNALKKQSEEGPKSAKTVEASGRVQGPLFVITSSKASPVAVFYSLYGLNDFAQNLVQFLQTHMSCKPLSSLVHFLLK